MLSPSWKAPLLTAPSPKKATATRSDSEELEAVAGAGGLEDARADDPAGAHQADLGREEVHAAAAAVRAARGPAEQLGGQRPRLNPLGQRMAVPAVGAEDDVVGTEMRADADGDRLLADVGVAGPVHQAPLVRPRQVLLAPPDRLHPPIQGQQAIGIQPRPRSHGRHPSVALRKGKPPPAAVRPVRPGAALTGHDPGSIVLAQSGFARGRPRNNVVAWTGGRSPTGGRPDLINEGGIAATGDPAPV